MHLLGEYYDIKDPCEINLYLKRKIKNVAELKKSSHVIIIKSRICHNDFYESIIKNWDENNVQIENSWKKKNLFFIFI